MTQHIDQTDRTPGDRPPRVDWFGAPALRLHAVMILGVALSTAAAWLEWSRALAGHHEIAWVYGFEWPLFAVMGVYLWWKLLHPDQPRGGSGGTLDRDDMESAPGRPSLDDPGLAAWEAYLARLHAVDPPGGPPPKRT